MTLFSISGTGLRLLSPQKLPEAKTFRAVVWVTFCFAPILPIRAMDIRIQSVRKQNLKFDVLQNVPLAQCGKAILKTYVFSWLCFPILFFLPLILAVKEVQLAMGIPEKLHFILMVVAIVWLVGAVWKMFDWAEDRWQK